MLTALSVWLTSNTSVSTTGAVVLGGWLVKIVVLIIILVLIRNLEFYDHVAFFVTRRAALVATALAEVQAVITSKVTYIGRFRGKASSQDLMAKPGFPV